MALASIPTRSPAAIAGCARRIEVTATASLLVLDDGRRVVVAGRPDPAGARRCGQSLNHLVSVRIEGSLDRPTARLRGIGNRLPVILTIPVATALALVDAGVPAIVRLTEEADV
jgi:hypothetical protein